MLFWLMGAVSFASPTLKANYQMVSISSGQFVMGSPPSEAGRFNDEQQRTVKLTKDYLIGKTEVTQQLWLSVFKESPSRYPECGAQCPVDSVTWCDAIVFSNELSRLEGFTPVYTIPAGFTVGLSERMCNDLSGQVGVNWRANGYRLPTEAEWEYAAKGNRSEWAYAGGTDPDVIGWHSFNSGNQSQRVCLKRSNGYGLCDMSGNVSEWVWDRYDALGQGMVINPRGSKVGTTRVIRGGSCRNEPRYLRISNRGGFYPGQRYDSLGFRLARNAF